MKFLILGPVEIIGDSGQIARIPPRERIVIGMLLLDAGQVVPVERLVDAVWDEFPPNTARKQILICVSVLRKLLGKLGFAGEIVSHPPGYALHLGEDDQLDLKEFEAQEAAARAALAHNRLINAIDALSGALGYWRGEPLEGTAGRTIEAAGVQLTERRLSVAEIYADLRLRLRIYHGLIEDLHQLIAAHPFRETLYSRLMRALVQAGRPVEAIAAYQAAHRTFVDELGMEPGAELRRLRSAIMAELGDAEPPAPANAPADAPVPAHAPIQVGAEADFAAPGSR